MPISVHAAELRLVKRFQVFSQVAAVFVVLTGSATLLGWALGIEILKSVIPSQVAMKPNAAVAFVLCGIALWCLAVPATVGLRRKTGRACASLAAITGLLTLGEYLFRLNFGIDQLLFIEKAGAVGTYSPGRMAPLAALSFLLIGLALLLVDVETRRGLRPAQLLTLPAVVVAILAVLEYLFGIPRYYGIASITRMAVHGAVAFMTLCAGILCARPDRGFMTIATSDAQGGAMWRRLLPVAFLAPVLLAWLHSAGERAGHFGSEMGAALLASSLMVLLVAAIWTYAKSLDRADCERRRMEDQTRANFLYARSLIEASLDPLVTISSEGKITDLNEATTKVTGVPREKLIGSDFSTYFTEQQKAREGYRRVFSEGFVSNYPLTIRHADGRLTDVLYSASVFKDPRGNVLGVFAAARDIAERKSAEERLRQSEARFRTLTETIPQLIWTATPDGRGDYFSRQWIEYTGVPEAKQFGPGWLAQLHPDDRKRVEDIWIAAAKTGGTYDVEYRIRRHDGEYRWFKVRGVPMRDAAGKIVKWFGSSTDIQDLKDAEAELEQRTEELAKVNEELACSNEELISTNEELIHANTELARSNAELEQFAYVASHDLQEPLRKIVAFGDRLATHAGDKLDDQGRNYLEHMQHGALRMGQLIDSLLELSRVATRGAAFEPLNLNKVVPEVLADLEVLLLKAGGRVEVAQLPTLMADRAQMCQLFQNLVINALKFHRRNVPPVVRIFSRKGPDKFWELHVTDNGIGFEEVYLDRIFRPFQRLNPRSEYEGSGMGLAICQKIVARHGGQITAHSQPGVGSDFVVTLPAAAHLSKEAKAS